MNCSLKMRSYIITFFAIAIMDAYGQLYHIGQPEIVNYNKENYTGGTQNWAITSGYRNVILVANNDGLLIFDGNNWKKKFFPNKTIARSVAYDHQSQRIYAGGQDEVGYFYPDQFGFLTYHSIRESIPAEHSLLEDVWDLRLNGNFLYFRSLHRIFRYDGKSWDVFSGSNISFLATAGKNVVYNDLKSGLYILAEGTPSFIKGSEIFRNINIIQLIELPDGSWIIFTEKEGIYIYSENQWKRISSKESDFLKANRVHSASIMKNGNIAIGTHLGGLVILDDLLNIKLSVNKNTGLQNNTVSSLFSDQSGNLWVGTYNGIDCIKLSSDFSSIIPDGNLSGAVYDIAFFKNRMYCGTENGLYYKELMSPADPLKENAFKLVSGSEGQVWGLDIISGDLIMNHNEGAFVVKENTVKRISSVQGAWRFIEWQEKGIAIGGFYNGLFLFRKVKDQWIEMGKIAGFDESSRILLMDVGSLWMSHPYRGLFKLKIRPENLTAEVKVYGTKDGLPTNYRNHVFRLQDHIVVAAEKGLFKYEKSSDNFVRLESFNSLFGRDDHFKKLALIDHYLWFVTEKESGYLKINDNILSMDYEKKSLQGITPSLVAGFENLYPLENGEAMFMTSKGVRYYHPDKSASVEFTPYISGIKTVHDDNWVYEGFEIHDNRISELQVNTMKFKSDINAFIFYFATKYPGQEVEYRYMNASVEKDWSDWSSRNYKEYNNLQPGKHVIRIQAKDSRGQLSEIFDYSFVILPPWYMSTWAYLIYLLLFGLGIWYSRMRIVKKFESKTHQLETEKKISDEKVLLLENEKLEQEINFKNKELGLSTMHLLQKNETLGKLRQELHRIKKDVTEKNIRQELNQVISILSDDERLEEDWESFSVNFDLVHNDFLKRIKEQYPVLTPKDLKLCAYLKMNLSSKELAPLLNISVRGVEISRYRLRKKLDLPGDTNLNDFMMRF